MKFIILFIVKVHSMLPLTMCRCLGRCYGNIIYLLNTRIKRTTLKNIKHCLPQLDLKSQKALARKSCIHTGMAITESFWVWDRPAKQIVDRLEIENESLLTENLEKECGLVLSGPHLGCWEIITVWAATYIKTSAFYRPVKQKDFDSIIKTGRSKTGAQMYEGSSRNLRTILQRLRAGEVFVVLSDQEPMKGSGVYAPFFDQPAYTMTLPQKLIKKTNAQLLLFSIPRTKTGWTIKLSKPCGLDEDQSSVEFATNLNRSLQELISQHIAQFEWGYKRFKSPPDGDYDFYPE